MPFTSADSLRADLIKMVQRTMVKNNLKRPLNEPEIRRMCKEPGAIAFDRIRVLFPATGTRTSVMILADLAAHELMPSHTASKPVAKQTPIARVARATPVLETALTAKQLAILDDTVNAVRQGWLEPEFTIRQVRSAYQAGHHPAYSNVVATFGLGGSNGWAVFVNQARKRLIKEGLLNTEDVGQFVRTRGNHKRWTKSDIVKTTVKVMMARGLEPDVTIRQLFAFSREDGTPGPGAITHLFAIGEKRNGLGVFQLAVAEEFEAEQERSAKTTDDFGIKPLGRELAG